MRTRLAMCKRQYIYKGGRLTLIKSIPSSQPIYMMSPFKMSKAVTEKMGSKETFYGEEMMFKGNCI